MCAHYQRNHTSGAATKGTTNVLTGQNTRVGSAPRRQYEATLLTNLFDGRFGTAILTGAFKNTEEAGSDYVTPAGWLRC